LTSVKAALFICLALLLVGSNFLSANFSSPSQASTDEGGNDENAGDPNESQDPDTSGPVPARDPNDSNSDKNNDGGDNDKPLPYCGEEQPGQSCHDLNDVDEVTGKFPCNDGTQRSNKADCPDATKSVLPQQPLLGPSSKSIVINKFSIQGSGLPTQTGPIPMPKDGEALLKVIYEGEWSGNILDSNLNSATYDGKGNYAIVFPCTNFGTYSLSAQKMDDGNDLMQLVVQDNTNQTLDKGQTTAEFGIVSLTRDC
jgi:hypothetical protein